MGTQYKLDVIQVYNDYLPHKTNDTRAAKIFFGYRCYESQ